MKQINLLIFALIFNIIRFSFVCADDEIVIGWIGPLTGPSAVLGVDSVEVARQRFEEINSSGGIDGKKIKFLVEDDQYATAKTVNAYNKLVKIGHAKILIVLTYGGLKAIADKAEKDDVILIDPLDCDDDLAALPRNTFCVAKRTEDLGIKNAEHALKNNQHPSAIIYFDGDPFPVKVAKTTKQVLEKIGSQVAIFEGVSTGSTTDFRTILIKAKQKQVKSLFVYGHDDFGLAFKQADELGLDATFYSVPGAGLGSPGFDQSAGNALNKILASGWFAPRTPAYQEFRESYKTKFGRYPFLDVATVPTYDIAKILVSIIEKSKTEQNKNLSPESLRNSLYNIKNYSGLSGDITIDSDGGVHTMKINMYSYRDKGFELIEK